MPYATTLDEVLALRAENTQLRAALDIARTALLNIERRSEEGRAQLTRLADEQSTERFSAIDDVPCCGSENDPTRHD